MATSLDIFGIKQRVEAILQNNSTLYTTTGEAGKIRAINSGVLVTDFEKNARPLPIIYITNTRTVEDIIPTAPLSSNAATGMRHVLKIYLYILGRAKDGQKAEEESDDFAKLVKEIFDANADLRDPSAGTDPKASISYIERDESLAEIGSTNYNRRLTLRIVAYTT